MQGGWDILKGVQGEWEEDGWCKECKDILKGVQGGWEEAVHLATPIEANRVVSCLCASQMQDSKKPRGKN